MGPTLGLPRNRGLEYEWFQSPGCNIRNYHQKQRKMVRLVRVQVGNKGAKRSVTWAQTWRPTSDPHLAHIWPTSDLWAVDPYLLRIETKSPRQSTWRILIKFFSSPSHVPQRGSSAGPSRESRAILHREHVKGWALLHVPWLVKSHKKALLFLFLSLSLSLSGYFSQPHLFLQLWVI
jgi:hypothetical protein